MKKLNPVTTHLVLVKAVGVRKYGNGVVVLELPARELSEEDRQTLERLFPNLADRVYQVLDQESLLSCLHTGAPPEPEKYDPITEEGSSENAY